jgi:hypothetical protein
MDPKVLEAFKKVAMEAIKKECKADQEMAVGWSQPLTTT